MLKAKIMKEKLGEEKKLINRTKLGVLNTSKTKELMLSLQLVHACSSSGESSSSKDD